MVPQGARLRFDSALNHGGRGRFESGPRPTFERPFERGTMAKHSLLVIVTIEAANSAAAWRELEARLNSHHPNYRAHVGKYGDFVALEDSRELEPLQEKG